MVKAIAMITLTRKLTAFIEKIGAVINIAEIRIIGQTIV